MTPLVIAGTVLASRVIVWGAGIAAMAMRGRNQAAAAMLDPTGVTAPFHSSLANWLVAPAARWDSVWYMRIAHFGYFSRLSSAFYPLYPLLLRAGGTGPRTEIVVGTVISILAMTLALVLLYRLAKLDLTEQQAKLTVILVALFPTSLFLSAVYTEALFLLLSVGAIYCARLDRWAPAALLACAAGLARPNGVLLIIPLLIVYFYGPRPKLAVRHPGAWWRPRYNLSPGALWLLLVPVGLAGYLGYLWISHDAPLAPFQAEAGFFRSFAGPFGALATFAWALPHTLHLVLAGSGNYIAAGDPLTIPVHDLVDSGFVIFAVVGLLLSWRRLPAAYTIYTGVFLAQALSEPFAPEPLASIPRYVLVIFPLFMGWAAAISRHRWTVRLTLITSSSLLAVFSGLWATWAWIA